MLPDFPADDEPQPTASLVSLTEPEQRALRDLVTRGADELGVDAAASPAGLAESVDRWLRRVRREGRSVAEDVLLAVGAAYGHAVATVTGWQWTFYLRQGAKELALASLDGAHVHLPVAFIARQAAPTSDVTAILLLNMLVAHELPDARPGALDVIG